MATLMPELHFPASMRGLSAHRVMHQGEDTLLTASLGLMMALPLAEVVLRRLFGAGISGVTSFTQHLTLLAGMLGAAVAAREDRLLSFSALETVLPPRVKSPVRFFNHAVAGMVSMLLALSAFAFVSTEASVGKVIAYGMPAWMFQAALPLGFIAIALRLIRHGSHHGSRRLFAAVLTAAPAVVILTGVVAGTPSFLVPGLALIAAAAVLGAPIFVVLGGVALLLFWTEAIPTSVLSLDHYRLVTNPVLPSVPLFTLAGYLLAEGNASRRLLRLFQALVGRFRAGPAILTALLCAFFTSFTGGSGVTILALGGLLMPVLMQSRYSERMALGLLTGAGSLGILLPPCLPLIFYAVIAQVSIYDMFCGGIVPGLLLVAMVTIWAVINAPKGAAKTSRFDGKEAAQALWQAKWELLVPVVAIAALFSGWATPVESAAVTAFYVFIIQTVVHRDLRLAQIPKVATECGLLVGGVLLILGVAMGFTNYLVDAEVPARAADWLTATVHSRWLFLLLLNLFLVVVGALMDIFSAIVIVVPLIVPIGTAFGIDPVHLGIIFLANAELGFLMPPVGENLFLSAYRFNKPVTEVFRSVVPLVLVFLAAVLLITYVPALTTALPRLAGR